MPTYRYECSACGHPMEVFQSMTERPKRKCPSCGKPKLQRMIGAGAAVIFKGGGFYETDYRSSSYQAGEKAAASSDDKGGAKSESGDKSSGEKAAAKPTEKASKPPSDKSA